MTIKPVPSNVNTVAIRKASGMTGHTERSEGFERSRKDWHKQQEERDAAEDDWRDEVRPIRSVWTKRSQLDRSREIMEKSE